MRMLGLRFGPVDTVRQLYHGHNRKRSFSFSVLGPHAIKDLTDILGAPLSCDQDTGIEN